MIIFTEHEFREFLQKFTTYDSFISVIPENPHVHPASASISLIFVTFAHDDSWYVISLNHTEFRQEKDSQENVLSSIQNAKTFAKRYTFNKKQLLHHLPKLVNVIDICALHYIATNTVLPVPVSYEILSSHFSAQPNINSYIPLVKHIEFLSKLHNIGSEYPIVHANYLSTEAFRTLNEQMLPVLYFMERNGLKVDEKLFASHFPSDKHINVRNGYVYTEYNPYTSTGRPSNRFGGINFAALEKSTGERSVFVSRFGRDGYLLGFDYDAYHLRLIAHLIQYTFPSNRIHRFLASQYFNVPETEVTEEQYDEAKKISFRMLYGGILDEYKHIEFFSKVQNLIMMLWNYHEQKFLTSLSGRKIVVDDPNPLKVFNYYIQLLETESNMQRFTELVLMDGFQSKIILYTYDSLLIDYHQQDGPEFVLRVKQILEQNGQFPTKVYIGSNYHEMENVTAQIELSQI